MKLKLLAATAALALSTVPAAHAAIWTTQLEYDLTGKIPSLGVVTVKDGADATLRGAAVGHEIDVTVHLDAGAFVDTGKGHSAFVFNLVDDPNNVVKTYSPTGGPINFVYQNDLTTIEDLPPCTGSGKSKICTPTVVPANPPPYDESPFGDFNNAFALDPSGGKNTVAGDFVFTITNTDSPISFADNFFANVGTVGKSKDPGPSGWWFAADTSGTDGNCSPTCAIGGRTPVTTITHGGVPEPATWTMMLLGFGGLGAMLRRRRAVTT
jgi:hypothetical protein